MKLMIKKFWQNAFWRNNVIYLFGSLAVAFLNYLYHPVLGRLLSVDSFGEVQVLISILTVFGMALAGFQIVSVNIAVNDKKNGTAIVHQFEQLVLIAALIISSMVAILSPSIQSFFGFESAWPFVALSGCMILTVPFLFRRSFLQAKQDFPSVSLAGVINAFFKLVIAVILVQIGLSTLGAIGGLLAAQLIALTYVVRKSQKLGLNLSMFSKVSIAKLKIVKPHLKYLGYVTLVFLAITLLYTADVLFVKRYFSSTEAGYYAGVSAIAKIVFFGTASFAAVLLSSVGTIHTDKHNRAVLRRSFMMVLACGGAVLAVFAAIPELVIHILLGARYLEYSSLLPMVTLVMFLLAVANLYVHYYLALRRYAVVIMAGASSVLTITLSVINHTSVEGIVQNFLIGALLLVVLVVAWDKLYGRRQIVSE